MEMGAKYEHSLIFFLHLRGNFNRTASYHIKHPEVFCTVFPALRLGVLENNLLSNSGRAVTGSGRAPENSEGGGRPRGLLFQLFYACLSFLPRPSLPKWFPKLACSSGPTGELVCLFKRTCSCILIFWPFIIDIFKHTQKGREIAVK